VPHTQRRAQKHNAHKSFLNTAVYAHLENDL